MTDKRNPCGNNLLTDHIFDTDYPDGCFVCEWTWKEIRQGYQNNTSEMQK